MIAALTVIGLVACHLLWTGTLLAGLVGWLLGRGWPGSARWRGRLVGMALLLLPFGAIALAWAIARDVLGSDATIMVTPEHAAGGAPELDLLGTLMPMLGGLAVAASGIGVLGLAVSLIRVELLRRRSGDPSAEWVRACGAAAVGLHLPLTLRLRSAPVAMPTLIGCFRPTVLVPEGGPVEALDPDDRHHLMAHELAHVIRRDGMALHLTALLRAVMTPVPAVHWLARVAEGEREAACDALVVGRGLSARRYTEALLRLASGVAGGPATLAVPALGGSLADRVERLLYPRATGALTIAPALAVSLLCSAPIVGASLWLPPTRDVLAAAIVPDRMAIAARDAAGAFAVEFVRGRPVAASAEGVPLPRPLLVGGDSLQLRTAAGDPVVTLRLERHAFTWNGRPPVPAPAPPAP